MHRSVAVVVLMAASASCSPSSGDSVPSESVSNPLEMVEAQVSEAVEGLVGDFWEAWASADVDGGLKHFSEGAIAITKTGAILRGLESIDAAWRPGFGSITGQVIDFSDSFVAVHAPDLASSHQVGTFLVQFSDGTTEGPIPFTYTTVWRLQEDGWKIIVAHRTDPPNPTT